MSIATIFAQTCEQFGLPKPVPEFRFHHERKWRFDYCWPASKVALEVEGAVWVEGRHTRGSGFVKDIEKYNSAGALGWIIIRCEPRDLFTVKTTNYVKQAIANR